MRVPLVEGSVAVRTQELGLRMALGARPRLIARMLLARGLLLAAGGGAAGLLGALALQRAVAGILYGVSAADPATFVGVAVLLGITALLGAWLPARRATRVDPLVALRSE